MTSRRRLLVGGGALLAAGGATWAVMRQMGSMDDQAAAAASMRTILPASPEKLDLIRYSTLAANSHNTQPWRFAVSDGQIEILPDMSRRLSAVDPDNHHLFASLGCAAENLYIAAGANGQAGDVSFNPANDGSVVFAFEGRSAPEPTLFDAIPKRQSTRGDYDGSPVSAADLRTLATAAAIPGVDLVMITDRSRIERVRDLVVAGNSAQLADPAFVRELKHWLRFSPRQAIETGDGLFSASSGNPALPTWLGSTMFDLVFTAKAENEKYARQLASTVGIAIFVAEKDDREHWVLAGRACQRFALQATALGLKHAFINQPVEVAGLRPELASVAGFPGRRPDIVMRFGYGSALPYSARRPVQAVIANQ
jgi:Nitroreductase family